MRQEITNILNEKKFGKRKTVQKLLPRETKILKEVWKTHDFKKLVESGMDHPGIAYLLGKNTTLGAVEVDVLASKVYSMTKAGLLDKTPRSLTEATADSTSDDHDGMEDFGMYGIDDGMDSPSGDADKGVNQKGEIGDAPVDQKGYLDEDDEDDEEHYTEEEEDGPPPEVMAKIKAKQNQEENEDEDPVEEDEEDLDLDMDEDHYPGDGDEGGAEEMPIDATEDEDFDLDPDDMVGEQEVPVDAEGTPEDNLAAGDATHKDGVKQNESRRRSFGRRSVKEGRRILRRKRALREEQDHDPKAKNPGVPSAGKHDDKKDAEDMDLVKDHPDYASPSKEDPSKSELNKGPAKLESFIRIESAIVSALSKSGIKPGTRKWANLYRDGFKMAIGERAIRVGSRLRRIQESFGKKKQKN